MFTTARGDFVVIVKTDGPKCEARPAAASGPKAESSDEAEM